MMSPRRQWTLIAGGVLALSGALAWGARHVSQEIFPATIGIRAPEFEATTIDPAPKPRKLSDYRGQVVLLNIWATWCPPCVHEMPTIEALYRDYGPQGLKVVAVSIDDAAALETVRSFVASRQLTFDVLHDRDGRVQRLYEAAAVPETFLIGRDGVIRKKMTGEADWNSPANRAVVAQLLTEKGP